MRSFNSPSNRRRIVSLLALASLLALLVGCGPRTKTELEYAPQMYRSPAYKAQQYDPTSPTLSKMRTPPAGTVAIDYEPYRLTMADSALQEQMPNPLPRSAEVLAVGQKYYNIYCVVCHGPKGDGMGYVVPKGFPKPPSYLTGATRQWGDGRIFYLITRGRGNMSSYAAQLNPTQRWSIVHYIRALQRAANPSAGDLDKSKSFAAGFNGDVPDTSVVVTKK